MYNMAWIEISDTLSVYSVVDDMMEIFLFILLFLKEVSKVYYMVLFFGFVILIIALFAKRIGLINLKADKK